MIADRSAFWIELDLLLGRLSSSKALDRECVLDWRPMPCPGAADDDMVYAGEGALITQAHVALWPFFDV